MSAEFKNKQIVKLKDVRFSFLFVEEPRNDKYSATILVDKGGDDEKALKNAYMEAIEEGKKKYWNGKMPIDFHNTVYDGNGTRPKGQPFGVECKDKLVFTATSKKKPEGYNEKGVKLDSLEEFYSGMYGAVIVKFFPYSNSGNSGVSSAIIALQKRRDGERLAGIDLDNAFDPVEGSNTQAGGEVALPSDIPF